MGHQTRLFAAGIAALIIACMTGWAVSDAQVQARSAVIQINPFAMMSSAKQLPIEHFQDYSFVY
jgi:hypothetical protein